MEGLFLKVLSMSATAAIIILVVLLARLLLRRAPKVFSYALWAVVLFRLLCPIAIQTPWSMTPSIQVEPAGESLNMMEFDVERAELVIRVDNFPDGRSEFTPAGSSNYQSAPAAAAPRFWAAASIIWLAGAVILLGYSLISLLVLRRRLVGSVPLAGEKNVWLADHIPSPFVLGVVRPRIYLPSNLPENERDYILLHERTHIRRGDHVFRVLAWLALVVHWLNPLVWLAFHLAGKDMEMSCDEAVLRKMGRDVRTDYSTSLLRLSAGGKLPAGPLAFGGSNPQSRIQNVLRYKKPALWVMVAALAVVLCTGVTLATASSRDTIPYGSVSSVAVSVYRLGSADAYREDLLDPAGTHTHVVSEENSDSLIRMVNAYRKDVYPQGDQASTDLDDWVRIDCIDGGFYMLHYWYWNGFSFNPLHYGEDDYTTLVTYYDAQGNAGTTWQMEYGFDGPFSLWLQDVVWPVRRGEEARQPPQMEPAPPEPAGKEIFGVNTMPAADLTFQAEHFYDKKIMEYKVEYWKEKSKNQER